MVFNSLGFRRSTVLHQGADSDEGSACPSLDAYLGLFVAMLVRNYSQAIG